MLILVYYTIFQITTSDIFAIVVITVFNYQNSITIVSYTFRPLRK